MKILFVFAIKYETLVTCFRLAETTPSQRSGNALTTDEIQMFVRKHGESHHEETKRRNTSELI